MARVLGLYKKHGLLKLRVRDDGKDTYFQLNRSELYFKDKESIKDFIIQLQEELTKDRCGICGGVNTFADDCGRFYGCQPYVAHCRSCWDSHGHTTGER